MPRASNNQMAFLEQHAIELPKPQEQLGAVWAPTKWFAQEASAIIVFLEQGNGADGKSTLAERLVFYQDVRQIYEGKFVLEVGSADLRRHLVLSVVPETQGRVGWLAKQKGIDISQVNPFCFDMVAEDEPVDYQGHIRGPGNLGDYCLAEEG